jgi:hypothetical protein
MAYTKAADGITKTGKTKGKNLGDSGPMVGIQSGAKNASGAKTVTGMEMRKVGRNMARAMNQRGG